MALVGLLQLWEQWRELGQRRKVNSTGWRTSLLICIGFFLHTLCSSGSASKSLLTVTNLTEDVTEVFNSYRVWHLCMSSVHFLGPRGPLGLPSLVCPSVRKIVTGSAI